MRSISFYRQGRREHNNLWRVCFWREWPSPSSPKGCGFAACCVRLRRTHILTGSPPAGEDDGLGGFCKNDELSPGTAGQLYSRTAEQDGCAEQYAPTPSFSPRSEPEGRVSGMIRANPVKICVTRSVIIIYLCLLKESDTLRFTLSPQPVIARLVPGNPVKNSAALAAILNGGASRRHAKRDNYLPLSSQRK